MLQFLSDLPKNVVGIEVNGEVTKDEYDKVVIPRLDDLVKRQGEINYIVVTIGQMCRPLQQVHGGMILNWL